MNILSPHELMERLEKYRVAWDRTFPDDPIPAFRITESEMALLKDHFFSIPLYKVYGVELEIVGNPK